MSTTDNLVQHTFVPKISIARLPGCSYPAITDGKDSVSTALHRIAADMGWADQGGAFGKVIPPGARVLIKPNLVLHQNEGPGGFDCLVTHASLIQAAVEAALRTSASEVLVGDAPIQACDFGKLINTMGLQTWAQECSQRDPRFLGIRDFRRTTCVLVHGVRVAAENVQSADHFTLFDLNGESLLEPVSDKQHPFRVAWYDPRLMANTHKAGVHQYLVAKPVLEADVIINLPKLKTHRKAGVTCALKNLIGINGNKEYLPHHRLGGSRHGGDCYPGNGWTKRALEYVTDRQNLSSSYVSGALWHLSVALLARAARLQGDRLGIDGSWQGNDTIWRTCLDLNRILLYGRSDGTMTESIQRRVVHIADAVIAGQGNGPLAPDPLELGYLIGGNNASAVDWVGAHLLAYQPDKIPLLEHAFDAFSWPIADFPKSAVVVSGDLGRGSPEAVINPVLTPVVHPLGWRGAAARASAPPAEMQEGVAISQWDA